MEKVLESVKQFQRVCQHNRYRVDPSRAVVECGICGESLNPMWVLEQFCNKESRAVEHLKRLKDEIERNADKLKCKCNHCGKMTNINRR